MISRNSLVFTAAALICVLISFNGHAGLETGAKPSLVRQIADANIFPDGFAWVETGAPPPAESSALLEALVEIKIETDVASKSFVYQTNGNTVTKLNKRVDLDMAPLARFVEAFPGSGWTPSIQTKLAKFYRDHGRYSLALRHWEEAWERTKTLQGPGKDIADFTFAHWTSLLASLGRLEKLKQLYAETDKRTFDGGPLQQMINATREGMQSMQATPGGSFQCGTYALAELARIFNRTNESARNLLSVPSPTSGFTMDRLVDLSRKAELDLVAVKRPAGDPIVVPSIVHWRQDHYAAIVAENAGYYRVTDPTFGAANWISKAAIDAEASGAFLVPRESKPPEWRALPELDLTQIHGQGAPNYIGDTNDQHSCNLEGYNGDTCFFDCKHMARWWVSEPYITLWIEDEPVGYQPSRGARMAFHLSYKQRDSRPESTNIFSFGKLWESSWVSRLALANLQVGQSCTPPNPCVGVATYDATLYLAGGGTSFFSNTNLMGDMSGQEPNRINQTRLVPLFDGSLNLTGFDLLYNDGSHDEYKYLITTGGTVSDALVTSRFDSAGNNTARFTYVLTNGVHRLTQVTDVDNRVCALLYTNTSLPYLATEVDDPFSRKAFLKYNSSGQLTNITDPGSLNSGVAYDGQGFVTTLTTPYGVTTFTQTGGTTNFLGGNTVNRSVQILDPNVGTQLYLYRDTSTNQLISSYSAQGIPGPLPSGTPYTNLETTFVQYRNSFYWDAKQYANLSTTTISALSSNDFLKGRMRHWLHVAGASPLRVSATLSIERQPAGDGTSIGQVIWYDYPGKSSMNSEGTNNLPSVIAWALPNTGRYLKWYRRNWLGNATNVVESYGSGLLRTNVYVYAANDQDPILHFGPSNELLESYAYNTKHQVTYFTNALGQVTHYIYNSQNQVQEVDYPTGLVKNNVYYSSGTYQNWLNYTYDSLHNSTTLTYSNGLVRSISDPRSLLTTYTWDNLQRLTGVAFPDSTYSSNIYNNLDLVGAKDRTTNWTRFKYNANRQLTTVTNANNGVTGYNWCNCGALDSVTDPTNKPTSFFYDLNSRRLLTVYPDGTTVSNVFNRLGQLDRSRDPAGNWTTNVYNNQGLLNWVGGPFGQEAALLLDKRDRMTLFTNSSGVVLSNTFDDLNRLVARLYTTNTTELFLYSANGLVAYTNQLGKVTRYQRDSLGRLITQTNANLEETRFNYNLGGDLTSIEDGNHHFTKWTYDIYGRVLGETNGLGNRVFNCVYDANGWKTSRVDGLSQTTTYVFDPVGNLKTRVYPTRTETFTYDPLNRLTTMSDSVGSTVFSYNFISQMLTEDGPWSNDTITYGYANQLRTNLSLQMPTGSAWTYQSSFDAGNRLKTLTSPAGTFNYDYASGGGNVAQASPLVHQIRFPGGSYTTNLYDTLARLKSTLLNNSSGVALAGQNYYLDAVGSKTRIDRVDGYGIRLDYDAINQVTNVWNKDGRPHETFSYQYDAANNLKYRTKDLFAQTFTPDAADQLSTVTHSSTYTVSGLTTTSACAVAVNGTAATVYSDNTFALGGFSLIDGTNLFTAIAQDVLGRRDTNAITLYAPATVTLTYDLNGNLRYDGQRAFDYDEENRLSRATVTNIFKTEWVYDGLGRRRVRKDYTWAGAWIKTNEVRFIFDGNLAIQERDTNNVVLLSYTRGSDFSGTRELAGGIGGLLAFTQHATTNHSFYFADGNGNIVALVNTQQVVVANYVYGPFGSLIKWSGSVADANRNRWSSMEYYSAFNLVLYKERVYDLNLQRWTSADPAGVFGGVNRHTFVGNNPLNVVDPWGLQMAEAEPEGEITREIRESLGYARASRAPISREERFYERMEFEARLRNLRDRYGEDVKPSDTFLRAPEPPTVSRPATPEEIRDAAENLLTPVPCPIRSGRRGNDDTKDQLDRLRDRFLEQNPEFRHTFGGRNAASGEPRPEEYIPGPGGARKGSSYPDLTFSGPSFDVRINTVDTTSSGFMTPRELGNFIKIMEATGEPVIVVPKGN